MDQMNGSDDKMPISNLGFLETPYYKDKLSFGEFYEPGSKLFRVREEYSNYLDSLVSIAKNIDSLKETLS